jgi:hypothetical protein
VSERRTLKFADADAVAAEVRRLGAGYTQAGNWSLPQVCWHLSKAIRFSMRPGPHPRVKTGVMQWVQLKAILAVGRIPAGVHAPDRITPANDTPESAVDEFFGTLEEMKQFNGEFAPHPMLGNVRHGSFVRLHLIHCAHHLGFLSPINR